MGLRRSFIFDLDGTLIDNVYEHVLAWKAAFAAEHLHPPSWRIHRKIGMSGVLLVRELASETGADLDDAAVARISAAHSEVYRKSNATPQPTPGAIDLLHHLTASGIRWAVATSAHLQNATASLQALGPDGAIVVTGGDVAQAKPDPALFLEAARRLGAPASECIVVGDAVWDMIAAQRCGAAGTGLLCGGTAEASLRDAGARDVVADPADLLRQLDVLNR